MKSSFYDEMSGEVAASSCVRPFYRDVDAWLQRTPRSFLSQRRHDTEFVFRRRGSRSRRTAKGEILRG